MKRILLTLNTIILIMVLSGCTWKEYVYVECEYPELKQYKVDSNITINPIGYDEENIIINKKELKDLTIKYTNLKSANKKANEQIRVYTEVVNAKGRNK